MLEALGAEIIRTPTEAAWDSPESHIGVARRLKEVIPNSHILDQYSNPSNPIAHEEGTGREIIDQCGGKLDAVVMTAGTGGTITRRREGDQARGAGLQGHRRRSRGLDPRRPRRDQDATRSRASATTSSPTCSIAGSSTAGSSRNDRDSFLVARQLIRQEGLLVGGSSGAAVWAAMQVCRELGPGKRVVVILPDSIRNYLTKFADDRWMRQQGFVKARLGGRHDRRRRARARPARGDLARDQRQGQPRDRPVQAARDLADAGARRAASSPASSPRATCCTTSYRGASTRTRSSPR